MNYLIVIILVLFSGLFSGLTLGLLSLSKDVLRRKISLGDKMAEKVYAVRKRGNLLLCTLLLGNVAVNSVLAIFLGDITSGVMAAFLATGLIVIFGEIIPQASFSKYAMWIGSKTAWLVKIFIFILFPICWPLAWVLDKFLGEEMPTIYSRGELIKIIEEQQGFGESDIDEDEERIVRGALSYSNKMAEEIMTPRTVVFALNVNSILDDELLNKIKEEGFTRIPVYKSTIDSAVGILYAKDLINIKPKTKIIDIYKKEKALTVSPKIKLDELLNMFIKSKTHIAFIRGRYKGLNGVVTLEDVLEEILRREIVDETDKVPDLQKEALMRG